MIDGFAQSCADVEPIGAIVRRITVAMARDAAFEAWSECEMDPSQIPPPSLFTKCRTEGASDALIVRLIHRLYSERKLTGYAQDGGLPFLNLCRHFARKDAA